MLLKVLPAWPDSQNASTSKATRMMQWPATEPGAIVISTSDDGLNLFDEFTTEYNKHGIKFTKYIME
ncbi:hypothetical protein JAAARDRAFT_190128 [Jaapia argillacea MUCL 33604]|uniref:Uncharacterized protein n=1 Tax=Jaapia argillacea MUCL 33604 TaxID=933084 RepID=A0A067Q2Q4_9AGAM|nr:hypothetical protein JAAARDRAFT_190128 [Jaapia argillacea MUCL 33604]